ncbi:hypothetical protein [Escherichia coli]|uniref:hypothetical protein n=1 Tax=Escherichia coli TaxID=562 RepID=UPI0039ED1567
MSHQDHIIKKALIDLDILRIQQLASTAERKQKIYKDPQGRTRIIKARPAKRGQVGS